MSDSKYSVFIIDDERPACRKIELLINLIDCNFEISGCAKNGKEFLEIYSSVNPDLLFVDIQMPVMNGLELIGKIREINVSQAIIIISCHENFHYAKEAMNLGVIDYVIKDLLTKEELYSILLKAENILLKRQKTTSIKKVTLLENRNSDSLLNLVFSTESETKYDLTDRNNSFLLNGPYAVMCLSIDDFWKISGDRDIIINNINNTIYSILYSEKCGEVTYLKSGIFMTVVSFHGFKNPTDVIRNGNELLTCIRNELHKAGGLTVTAGVSDIFNSIDEVFIHYRQASELLRYSFFLDRDKTLFSCTGITKIPAVRTEKIEDKLERIKEYSGNKNFDNVIDLINELYETEFSGILQYNYIQHIHSSLISIVFDICKSCNISYPVLFGKNYIPFDQIESFESIEESREWFLRLFKRIGDTINKLNMDIKHSLHVKKAISLIRENPKISLQELSTKIFINKSYLSRLFRKETGITVFEYALDVRIELAKKMLNNPSVRICEIADRLGYEYAQQFTSDFKKTVGLAPSEFRTRKTLQ